MASAAPKPTDSRPHYFRYPEADRINQFETCFSTFFLVYSNRTFPVTEQLDTFYRKQEEDGAIRAEYLVEDGTRRCLPTTIPTGVAPPLFAWAEYNLYHKLGTKKRLREILPALERHFAWLEELPTGRKTASTRCPRPPP